MSFFSWFSLPHLPAAVKAGLPVDSISGLWYDEAK